MQSFEEEVVCPISLGPPVAPQITPCGHVFSFPAIIQHLARNPPSCIYFLKLVVSAQ